eukprot:CAMPEP_0179872638 /NCGR_PEP_ID=MMETSP0982-20121206/21632_1 /TAXON_ID=483367 /ORGANISM="non described non described, Strain CCMP 2436" /LENGTH=42 /DNA_ID= /DNA_START= /DNA_END= /DNA_ORIENTATION=
MARSGSPARAWSSSEGSDSAGTSDASPAAGCALAPPTATERA